MRDIHEEANLLEELDLLIALEDERHPGTDSPRIHTTPYTPPGTQFDMTRVDEFLANHPAPPT